MFKPSPPNKDNEEINSEGTNNNIITNFPKTSQELQKQASTSIREIKPKSERNVVENINNIEEQNKLKNKHFTPDEYNALSFNEFRKYDYRKQNEYFCDLFKQKLFILSCFTAKNSF